MTIILTLFLTWSPQAVELVHRTNRQTVLCWNWNDRGTWNARSHRHSWDPNPEHEWWYMINHFYDAFIDCRCFCSAPLPRGGNFGLPKSIVHWRFNFHSFDKAFKMTELIISKKCNPASIVFPLLLLWEGWIVNGLAIYGIWQSIPRETQWYTYLSSDK